MARGSETAARVLCQILRENGYIKTNADFARLLKINPTNISAYLAQPEKSRRISPRIDTIAQWCWAISQQTALDIQVVIDSSAELLFKASGHNADGLPIEEETRTTNYRELDQMPLHSWGREWNQFLQTYDRFLVESIRG
jgi:predicted transcriptional regulator